MKKMILFSLSILLYTPLHTMENNINTEMKIIFERANKETQRAFIQQWKQKKSLPKLQPIIVPQKKKSDWVDGDNFLILKEFEGKLRFSCKSIFHVMPASEGSSILSTYKPRYFSEKICYPTRREFISFIGRN